MTEWFEVSAEWMKACGYPAKARTFRAISKQFTWAYDPFFACMYTIDRDGTP